MIWSISTYFRLSAKHIDKQVMLHVLAKSRSVQFSVVSVVKMAMILIKFLIEQNKIDGTIFLPLIN